MSDLLTIESKKLLPIKEVTSLTSYSKDYITRLARGRKITARLVGRQWFVDPTSLQAYEESARIEQTVRKQKLSEERKRERELRDTVTKQAKTLTAAGSDRRQVRTAATAAGVVMCSVTCALLLVTNKIDFGSVDVLALLPTAPTVTTESAPPAAWLPEEMVVPHFTISSAPAATTTTAIVLMPDGVVDGQATVTEFFSDNVVTRTEADGTQVLVVTDEDLATEATMPFVAVPISPESPVTEENQTAYD